MDWHKVYEMSPKLIEEELEVLTMKGFIEKSSDGSYIRKDPRHAGEKIKDLYSYHESLRTEPRGKRRILTQDDDDFIEKHKDDIPIEELARKLDRDVVIIELVIFLKKWLEDIGPYSGNFNWEIPDSDESIFKVCSRYKRYDEFFDYPLLSIHSIYVGNTRGSQHRKGFGSIFFDVVENWAEKNKVIILVNEIQNIPILHDVILVNKRQWIGIGKRLSWTGKYNDIIYPEFYNDQLDEEYLDPFIRDQGFNTASGLRAALYIPCSICETLDLTPREYLKLLIKHKLIEQNGHNKDDEFDPCITNCQYSDWCFTQYLGCGTKYCKSYNKRGETVACRETERSKSRESYKFRMDINQFHQTIIDVANEMRNQIENQGLGNQDLSEDLSVFNKLIEYIIQYITNDDYMNRYITYVRMYQLLSPARRHAPVIKYEDGNWTLTELRRNTTLLMAKLGLMLVFVESDVDFPEVRFVVEYNGLPYTISMEQRHDVFGIKFQPPRFQDPIEVQFN